MSFRDSELTHADQTVHFAGVFITEERGRFVESHWEVAIGTFPVQVDLVLERAGHRTQGETLALFIVRISEDKHAVEIVIPVTGDFI